MRDRIRYAAPLPGLVLAVLLSLPGGVQAQLPAGWTGNLELGARTLSLSGGSNHEAKYREDVNFQQGLRLMGLSLEGNLAGRRFGLEAAGWGSDPYSSLNGWLKGNAFRLRFGGTNSQYYHTTGSQVEEYGLAGIPVALTRRNRWTQLDLDLGPVPLYVRWDGYRRQGTENGVWNIERERHAALSPVDENSTILTVGTSLPVAFAALDLSYSLYSLDNRYGTFLDGSSDGLDGSPSSLDAYEHIVHDEGSLPVLKANIAAPLGPVNLRLGYSSSSGTVDKTLTELEDGLDYNGTPVSTSGARTGSLDRTFTVLDAGLGLPLPLGLSADLSLRRTDFEVTGTWDGTTDVGTTLSTTRYLGRMNWRPMRGVAFDLGGAAVARVFEETAPGTVGEVETVTADWVGGFSYTRRKYFTLRYSFEVADIEDPYTRLAPTDRNIHRGVLNLHPLEWLTASLGYKAGRAMRYYSHDNADASYYFNTVVSDVRTTTIGLNLEAPPFLERLKGGISYSRGRLEMSIPISEWAPPSPPVFNYHDVDHAVTGSAGYELMKGLRLEADGSWYRATGQWPLYRFMRRIGVAKDLGAFTLLVDYRMYSLNQVADNFDDYDANLFTFGLRRGF
jgi:hypothetical protein